MPKSGAAPIVLQLLASMAVPELCLIHVSRALIIWSMVVASCCVVDCMHGSSLLDNSSLEVGAADVQAVCICRSELSLWRRSIQATRPKPNENGGNDRNCPTADYMLLLYLVRGIIGIQAELQKH